MTCARLSAPKAFNITISIRFCRSLITSQWPVRFRGPAILENQKITLILYVKDSTKSRYKRLIERGDLYDEEWSQQQMRSSMSGKNRNNDCKHNEFLDRGDGLLHGVIKASSP
jgi:hypothetical protein